MFVKVIVLIVGFLVLSGCATNSIVSEIDVTKKSKNETYALMGMQVRDINSRIHSISGICRYEKTGKNVPCFEQNRRLFDNKRAGRQVAGRSYSANKTITKKGKITSLNYANIFLMPSGSYSLHTIKYAIRTGTSTQYRNGAYVGSNPLIEWSELKLNEETAITFDIAGDAKYLGHFNVDLLVYDAIYRPVVAKISVNKQLQKTLALLPKKTQTSINQNNVVFDEHQLAKVNFKLDDFIRQQKWNSIEKLREFDAPECRSIFSNGSEGLKFSIQDNIYFFETKRFPTFPSFNFSKLMGCSLYKHMVKNSYKDFKRTGKISYDKESSSQKGFFADKRSIRKFQIPFNFK